MAVAPPGALRQAGTGVEVNAALRFRRRLNRAVAACRWLKSIANLGGNWKASTRIVRNARRPPAKKTLY